MERETTTIKVGQHDFEIKTYATAKEQNTIQTAYFRGTHVEVEGETPKITEFDPNVQYNVNCELCKQLIVKMDGSDENIVERCEELPNDDFNTLIEEIDKKITKKKKQ